MISMDHQHCPLLGTSEWKHQKHNSSTQLQGTTQNLKAQMWRKFTKNASTQSKYHTITTVSCTAAAYHQHAISNFNIVLFIMVFTTSCIGGGKCKK